MRKLGALAILVAIPLALVVIFLVRNPDIVSDVSEVKNAKRATIHIRTELAVPVEIVNTDALRNRGLSGRQPLGDRDGMLFVYPTEASLGIWMKEMLFPIDIIWMDREGKIITIAQAVGPETYPRVFTPTAPAMFVLETKSGFVDIYNVRVGDMTDVAGRFEAF